ncbi:MAG: TetR family transcriptional regulator [Deltaproteobacteria bacterium]|nr:TetR family transcriptional regulator [Deltaproteobacteria bacterium]
MNPHNKHLPAKERRAITVEAVVELAAEQNPSDITTAAIAKRMGLTQGALFRHFPNKGAILQAVMEWVGERLLARVDKAIQAASSPLTALEAVFMTHVEFVIERPGVPRILFGELQRAEETASKRMVQTLIKLYAERLRQLIEDGKMRKELDPSLDTEAAANLFIGTIQGLVMQSLLAGDVGQIRQNAPKVFIIYRRGIINTP